MRPHTPPRQPSLAVEQREQQRKARSAACPWPSHLNLACCWWLWRPAVSNSAQVFRLTFETADSSIIIGALSLPTVVLPSGHGHTGHRRLALALNARLTSTNYTADPIPVVLRGSDPLPQLKREHKGVRVAAETQAIFDVALLWPSSRISATSDFITMATPGLRRLRRELKAAVKSSAEDPSIQVRPSTIRPHSPPRR